MGDRANVYVHQGDQPGVYLYTHADGTALPDTVRRALARRERWDDDAYLTRIIFCEMVKGRETEATGYGIGATMIDGDDKIVSVDTKDRTVTLVVEGQPAQVLPFDTFIGAQYGCECGCSDQIYRCPGCSKFSFTRVQDEEFGTVWICLNPSCEYDGN